MLGLVLVGVALLGVPSANAATPWSVAANPGPTGDDIQVVDTRDGSLFAVWRAPLDHGVVRVFAARRPLGMAWSARRELARALTGQQIDVVTLARGAADTAQVLISIRATQPAAVTLLRWDLAGAGSWTQEVVVHRAREDAAIFIDTDDTRPTPGAALAIGPAGRSATVWCEHRPGANPDFVQRDPVGASLWLRESGLPAERLWVGRSCEVPAALYGAGGHLAVVWCDEAPAIGGTWKAIVRGPSGWSSQTELPGSDERPLLALDRAGRLTAMDAGEGSRSALLAYDATGNAGAPSREQISLLPKVLRGRPLLGGRLYGVQRGLAATDRGGPIIAAWLPETTAVLGPRGVAALSASVRRHGRWRAELVDRWADASSPAAPWADDRLTPPALIERDPGGRIRVAWTEVSQDAPCRLLTMHTERTSNGRWAPRRALVERAIGGSCDDATVATLGVSVIARAAWNYSRGRLRVGSIPRRAGRAPVPSVRLLTPTWRAVRAAGAVRFACRAGSGGACRISLLRAAELPGTADDLEFACRPLMGARSLPGPGQVVIEFPLADGCHAGAGPPPLPRVSRRVPITATFDVAGRSTTGVRQSFWIRP